jgi:hypothetical protein
MPEAFVHPSAADFCDSTGSSRRNSQEIFEGPFYSTIDDLSSDGGYFSPAENTTTVIQLNQEIHIDQSGLLSCAASTASSTQENILDEDKEGENSGKAAADKIETEPEPEPEAQAQAQAQEEKAKEEESLSVSLSTSSLRDGMLWLREDLLVASDNMLNVSVCRLDDLRQAIARLQKETQALEETDMILKRKIDYVVNSRVRVRQDVLDDMAIGWEFV